MSEPDNECGCGESGLCDRHFAEAMAEHAYLRGVPSEKEREQALIDAGRGHLVRRE